MKEIVAMICTLLVVLTVLIVAFGSWGTVDAGNVGVVLRMGAVTGEIKQPGFYTKTPWTVHVVDMNVQIQKEQAESKASSKDLQIVDSTISLNLSLDPAKAANVYQTIGIHYLESVFRHAGKHQGCHRAIHSRGAYFKAGSCKRGDF